MLGLINLLLIGVASGFSLSVFSKRFMHKTHAIQSSSHSTSNMMFKMLVSPSHVLQSISSPFISQEEEDDDEDEETKPTLSTDAPVISLEKEGVIFSTLNGSDVRVGILMCRWNSDIVQGLYKGVNESLIASGVKPSNIFTTYVPGAFELPITAKFLAASKRVDVIVCLGCLIKGDTMHFEVIAQACANGIMQVGIGKYIPILLVLYTVCTVCTYI
jgi:6,7-dimethyl-8-ribityllumazine synthase